MQKYLVPALAGLGTGVVVSVLFGLLLGPSFITTFTGTMLGIFTFYILANLAGNRKIAVATDAERIQALKFEAPADKALLYIYREGFVGMAAGLNITVDGKDVTQLKSPRFTYVTLAPGAHTVTAAFGGLAGPQNKPATLEFPVEAGGIIAVRVTLAMGLMRNSITIGREPDLGAVQAKLANTIMVSAAPV
jgi:hypothetical protein